MLWVIITQKDRSIGEILYEHNHEDLNKTLAFNPKEPQQHQYRKKELYLKKCFVLIYLGIVAGTFFGHIAFRIEFINPNDPPNFDDPNTTFNGTYGACAMQSYCQ